MNDVFTDVLIDVPTPEAGYAVAAIVFGLRITEISLKRTADHAGRTLTLCVDRLEPLEQAIVVLSGELAEKRLLGRREIFDWFSGDGDATKARELGDMIGGNVRWIRELAVLSIRSLLRSHWRAVQGLAPQLEQ
jgi:hypothetical protein